MSLSIPSAMSAEESWALANSTPSYLAPSEAESSALLLDVRSCRVNGFGLSVVSLLPSLLMCFSVMELEEREIISERIHGSSPLDSYDQTRVPASILEEAGCCCC